MPLFVIVVMLFSISCCAAEEPKGEAAGKTETATILSCALSQSACKPGFGVNITYRWDARPLDKEYVPFVHIRGAKHTFQDDHALPNPTTTWSGSVSYEHLVVTPMDAPEGEYKIVVGLWHPKTGGRAKLKAGDGVTDLGNNEYQVGTLKLSADAPVPPLPAPTLKLDGYHVTFDEDFSEKELSVSPWGPGTRWIAHTPGSMDFGDAGFADPEPGFPFTIERDEKSKKGILRIEARKTGGKWRTGFLCSVDPKGAGFAQKYGYFEMRAKLPKGAGTWPAFWLCGTAAMADKKLTNIEIDVLEEYGVNTNVMRSTVHLWHADGKHEGEGKPFIAPGMTDDFHNYGVLVTEENLTFYFDGVEMWKVKTPEAAKVPIYPMVDLALGGGWPIDKTPSPSYMYVEHVRAYAK